MNNNNRDERPKPNKKRKELSTFWKLILGFLAVLVIIVLIIWVPSIGQPQVLWADDFSEDKSNWGVNTTDRRIKEKVNVKLPDDYGNKYAFVAQKKDGIKGTKESWPNCKDIGNIKKPFFVSVTVISQNVPNANSSFGLVVRESQNNQSNQPTELNSGNFYKLDLAKNISSIEPLKPYLLMIEFSRTSVNFYINGTPVKGENSSGNFEPSFSFLGKEIEKKCIGFFPSPNETLYFYDFLAKTYLPGIEEDLINSIKIKDEDIKKLTERVLTLEQKLDTESQRIDLNEPVSQRLATIESKLEGEKTQDGKIVDANKISSSKPVGKKLSDLEKQVEGIIKGDITVTVKAEERSNPSTTLTKIYEDQKIILSVDEKFQKNLKLVFPKLN